jgi:proline dehydrogenase
MNRFLVNNDLLKIGADALKKAALSEEAKAFVMTNEKLFHLLKKAANRYIGGETLEDAITSIKRLNENGYSVTTDFMGESIRSEKDANLATAEFLNLAKAISTENVNSSISLDLSHIGLLVSKDLTLDNLTAIAVEASKANQEIIISMEGTDRTDDIIDIYKLASNNLPNLGITIQAYLHRTKDDFKDIIQLPGSIRLVKGAYDTPKHLSIQRGDLLDEAYLNYAEQLLASNQICSIASHDEKIYQDVVKIIDKYQPTNYVLERLLGICNEELEVYKSKNYQCRIYVVYGKEWYLYLCNRWAEYPLNMFRGLADIVG